MANQQPFRRGDHICVVYETPEEQLAVSVQYVAEGLTQNERCLYVADSHEALDQFRRALSAAGVDAAAAEANRALLLRTTDAAHLIGGCFDSERMLAMLNDAVEDALNDGFAGLRTCGDMSWLLHDAPGASQVVEYEGLLNQFFANARAIGMCLYDQSRMPQGMLDRALATHTSVVVDRRHAANPFYRRWPFTDADLASDAPARTKIQQLRASRG